MRPLVQYGLKHSVLMNLLFIGVIAYAAFVAIPELPVDRYPNFSFGEVLVITDYPGAAPEDVERLVTKEVEEAVRGMDDLEFVKSDSLHGRSIVNVKFLDDTDYDALYDDLRLRVLSVQNRMPRVNGEPVAPRIRQIETDVWLPVIQVNLVAQDTSLDKRALILLARELRNRIEILPGIKRTTVMGELPQQFVVALDPDALRRYRLTIAEVVAALQQTGMSLPAGVLPTAQGERNIVVDSRFRGREDILSVVIRRDGDGSLVRVADCCDLARTGIQAIEGGVRLSVNGNDVVGVQVAKNASANANNIKNAVQEEVADFLATHDDEPIDAVYTLDSTVKIHDGVMILAISLYLALALVMLALFLFLTRTSKIMVVIGLGLGLVTVAVGAATEHSGIQALAMAVFAGFVFVTCRASILTAAGIVFSFLGTLVVFHFAGRSINEVSLLGFVLTCGIIVDDAIVVLENIQRHREKGQTLAHAALEGSCEVFWPVVSATLTTCSAFLPLLLMSGVVGEFFSIIPIAVSVALGISLIECLLILPLHAVDLGRWFGEDPVHGLDESDIRSFLARPGLVGFLARSYDQILRWNFRHRLAAVGLTLALFLFAVGIVVQSHFGPQLDEPMRPILKIKFFPDDTSVLNIAVHMPSGTPLEETEKRVRTIARHLVARGEGQIANVTGMAGLTIDESYREEYNHQYGFLFVDLPERAKRTYRDPRTLMADIRDDLRRTFEGDGLTIEVKPQKDGPPTGAPVHIRVGGIDDDTVERLALDLHAWMHDQLDDSLKGIIDLDHGRSLVTESLAFGLDRAGLARLDMSEVAVQRFLAGTYDGLYVGDLLRTDDEIPVRVRVSRTHSTDPIAVLDLPIAHDPSGRIVHFDDVGSVNSRIDPYKLTRRDFQRTIDITGNLAEEAPLSPNNVNNLVDNWYKVHAHDYPGASIAFGGESESTQESYRSLGIAFLVALFLMYTILAVQFNSYLQPFLILSNIVFSFTGVVLVMGLLSLALMILGEGMVRAERSMITVQSFIAMIGLTGLVVNDAIVLIDFINKRRAEGMERRQAMRLAGHQRMRPILMTTITTIAGLLPMAIGIPYFSISWSPFATCFVSGLLVSTTMTLLVVPVLYDFIEDIRQGTRPKPRRSLTGPHTQGVHPPPREDR